MRHLLMNMMKKSYVHFIEKFGGEYIEEFMGILKEIAGRAFTTNIINVLLRNQRGIFMW